MSDSEAKDLAVAAPEMVDAQAADGGAGADAEQDAEIEAMRARVAEMEEEARKLSEAAGAGGIGGAGGAASSAAGGGAAAAAASGASSSPAAAGTGRPVFSPEQIADQDSRSIHVAQVDYSVTEEELKLLFEACGPVNRVTIIKDKFSGQPKGFAYVEFASASSIDNAMILNETEFKGRTLKITAKRTNIPGFGRGGGRGGRGGRGRGGPRGGGFGGGGGGAPGAGQPGGTADASGYGPIRGGRGGRGRGGRGGYHPYQQYQY